MPDLSRDKAEIFYDKLVTLKADIVKLYEEALDPENPVARLEEITLLDKVVKNIFETTANVKYNLAFLDE